MVVLERCSPGGALPAGGSAAAWGRCGRWSWIRPFEGRAGRCRGRAGRNRRHRGRAAPRVRNQEPATAARAMPPKSRAPGMENSGGRPAAVGRTSPRSPSTTAPRVGTGAAGVDAGRDAATAGRAAAGRAAAGAPPPSPPPGGRCPGRRRGTSMPCTVSTVLSASPSTITNRGERYVAAWIAFLSSPVSLGIRSDDLAERDRVELRAQLAGVDLDDAAPPPSWWPGRRPRSYSGFGTMNFTPSCSSALAGSSGSPGIALRLARRLDAVGPDA